MKDLTIMSGEWLESVNQEKYLRVIIINNQKVVKQRFESKSRPNKMLHIV